ncbi:MAG: substrate-binding domain-containing protein [Spirochaetota bacterium]
MRKFLTLMVVALVAVSGVYAGGQGEDGQVRLGVTIEDFNDVFMRFLLDELTDEAEQAGAEVIAADGKRDPNEQLKQIENFITQGVDAIIIHVIDQTTAPRISELTREAGIPLVYVNRRPGDDALEGDNVVAVASPEEVAGRLQAEYVVENMGTSGNVVILLGSLGSAPQIGRTAGAKEVFDEYPDIQVIREQTANFQRSEAVAVVENWLAAGDEIDAIVANNDEMALGATLVLEEAGLLDEVIVTGVDATPEAIEAVEAGRLEMTVFQNAAAQGRGAVQTALDLINGEDVENFVQIPFEPVTQENVDEYK